MARSAGDLLQKIDAAMADLDTTLDALSSADGGVRPYDQVDKAQRQQIAA
ncbi:hypothetical protein PSYJA_42603, partial [Pseudomonas syringae pv. japonica str. M301072]